MQRSPGRLFHRESSNGGGFWHGAAIVALLAAALFLIPSPAEASPPTKPIPMTLLLRSIGAPQFRGAEGVMVAFSDDGPPGIVGIACSRELFGGVEGNSQAICGDLPDRTALIFIDEIGGDRRLLLSTLAHEARHFTLGVDHDGDTSWERFREEEAYRFGDAYAAFACRNGGC